MSIFAKKPDSKSDTKWEAEPSSPAEPKTSPAAAGGSRTYGIADAIQLMRSLPVDQNVDLVVRVVRATLASLNVRVQDIIEDASRKEKTTQDGIAALHGKVSELEKELEGKRKEITALEAELKETTGVKERLQLAEKFAVLTPPAGVETHLGSKPPSPPLSALSSSSPLGSSGRLTASKPSGHEEPSSLKD